MNRDQKAAVVEEVAADIQSAEAIFAVDYRGMSVGQAAELRGKLIDAEASLRVVKNTLTQLAADKAGNEHLKALLEGPTALTFVNGDIAVAAKVIADFRRTNELPQFKGGSMGGDVLSAEQLDAIAKLPSRDILNAQLAGTIASPIIGLVRGLNALIAGIAIQLQAIADQGLVSGTDPEPEPAPSAEDGGQKTEDSGEAPAAEEAADAAEGTPAEPQATPDEQPPEPEAEAPAEPEAEAAPEPEAEAPAEPEAEAAPEPEAEAPAEPEAAVEETPAEETPSEAPGDPVAEAEAAEEDTSEETPSEGDKEETQEG